MISKRFNVSVTLVKGTSIDFDGRKVLGSPERAKEAIWAWMMEATDVLLGLKKLMSSSNDPPKLKPVRYQLNKVSSP